MKVSVVQNWGMFTDIYIYDQTNIGHWRATVDEHGELSMDLIPPEEEGNLQPPTIRLPRDGAEMLMQAMWDQGFRPAGKEPPDDVTLTALQGHIAFAESVVNRLLED